MEDVGVLECWVRGWVAEGTAEWDLSARGLYVEGSATGEHSSRISIVLIAGGID
jgi:hypothetical protein